MIKVKSKGSHSEYKDMGVWKKDDFQLGHFRN